MKKILSFFAAVFITFAVNAAVINITSENANSLRTALNGAATGDEIVMAAGTYEESDDYLAFTGKEVVVRAAEGAEVIIKTVCPVRLKEGAKAEFINVKFDCSAIGEYEYVIVAADDTDNKRVVLTGCEFYGWDKNKAMIEATSSRRLASVKIDKCYFHNCKKSVVFIENTGSIELSITNSTFENITTDASSFWAGVIDSRATAGSVLVDHCTFYNVQAMNTDYAAVGKVATPGAVVSNSIFALPVSTDGVRAIRDVANANNCITFNYLKDSGTGIHSSVTQNNCIQVDPAFVDPDNGNFTLGEGSPALTMNDGKPIGDPRWVLPVPKTVAIVEKLWSGDVLGWATADSRQWTGYGEYVYWESKANHAIVGTKDGLKVDTIIKNDLIDGTAFSVDGAGNFVVEGTFPSTASHIFLVKHDASAFVDIPVTGLGRTDIATATGDVFSAEGGVVFLYGNSVNLLAVAIKNAGAEGQEVKVKEIAIKGSNVQNFVVAGDTLVQYVQRRSVGQTGFDVYENGVNKGPIEGMTGYKGTTLGGAMVTLAGKVFAVYPAGATMYSSEFSVLNVDDKTLAVDKADASKTVFYANTTTKANNTNVGVFLNATKIDDNNAYIQVGNGSDGTALFKLSVSTAFEVTVSCDETQGTVTGGGDIAVGANATVVATPNPGYEFVAWKKGEETVSTDATYTFAVNENIALTAVFEAKENVTITLAVNDATLGSITLPEGIVMGENSVLYGTPVALVAVPAEGVSFLGWFKGEELYSTNLTISLTGKESISLSANFAKALVLSYELNGGVTNDYGWTSKPHMALLLQNDYNAAYSASKAWAKEENGVIYYYVGGEWLLPSDAQGKAADVSGFIQNVTYNTSDNLVNLLHNEKWLLLMNYIDTLRVKAGNPVADEGALRADLSGFFLCSPAITDYRHTNDYTTAGTEEAFLGANKIGFDNPTEIVTGVTLNAPYKEGFTFDGWYAAEDFSGEKITYVDPETVIPGNKLYAKWIEYIPTLAEITEMAENTETKAKGVVTYINNKNAYIQDASAGMLLFCKANPTFKVGDMVVVKGVRTVYGGAPELMNVEEIRAEAGTMPAPQSFATLAALTAEPLKHFGKLVSLKGLRIVAYDNFKNPSVTDGADTVPCYKMSLDDTAFPIGSKVNLTAIAGYFNAFQFVGDIAGFELSGSAGKDTYNYPVRGAEGDFAGYTLENDWLISQKLDNYADNVPGVDGGTLRSMVEIDGKMYFLNRTSDGNGYLVVVDGKTGAMSPDRINITGENLFKRSAIDAETGAPIWVSAVTVPFNHITRDTEGNMLVCGLSMKSSRAGQDNSSMVYVVDPATGAATELINEELWANADFDSVLYRFDAFGAWGDVKSHAVVMAMSASAPLNAFRWEINNGKAEVAEIIEITPTETEDFKTYLVDNEGKPAASAGISPTVLPLDDEYFWIDGQSTYPTMISRDGDVVDDFKNNHAGILKIGNNEGDTCSMQVNNNGMAPFQVGEDYFLLMAATCYTGTPNNAYALFKFKDASQSFAEMEPLWYFPKAGLGDGKGSSFQATPYVEVNGNQAKMYIYQPAAGYGVYTFTGKMGTGVEDIMTESFEKAQKVLENGVIYIYRNGVKYNVMGAEVK